MIEIKNITKLYKNGKGAKDINITFNDGDIVGLVGDNGAGKSTLIKSVFREIKMDSGDVLYNGESIFKAARNFFSYFPDQSSFPGKVKIIDYMIYYANLNGFKTKEAKENSMYLLKYFKLEEYANKTFKSLSAGMQKRALLAIALIIKPKVIFLDEPTANLDIKTRIEVLDLLKSLTKKGKLTIFITSHLIDELDGFINKLFIMREGSLVCGVDVKPTDDIKQIYLQYSNTTKEVQELNFL